MTRSFSVVITTILLGLFAMGQVEKQSAERAEVFGGLSWLSQDLSLTNQSGIGPIGWNASITFPQPHRLGLVADVSGYYPGSNSGCGLASCGPSSKIYTFLGGPQYFFTRGRIRPFARFLIGDTYMTANYGNGGALKTFTTSNSFTFGAGGGVDVKLNHRLSWRGQVDWLHNGFTTSDNQRSYQAVHSLARLSTGIVIRF